MVLTSLSTKRAPFLRCDTTACRAVRSTGQYGQVHRLAGRTSHVLASPGQQAVSRLSVPTKGLGSRSERRSSLRWHAVAVDAEPPSRDEKNSTAPIEADDIWNSQKQTEANKRTGKRDDIAVLKTIEMDDDALVTLEEDYEDLWKASINTSTVAEPTTQAPAAEAAEGSSVSTDGQNTDAESDQYIVSVINGEEKSTKDTKISSDGMQGPLHLLSIQVNAGDVDDHELRAKMITLGYQSGLVNAVLLEDCDLPSKALLKPASKLREICTEKGLRLIVENRFDIAVSASADGIVLDQGLDLESSRSFMQIMGSKDEAYPTVDLRDGSAVRPPLMCGRTVSSIPQAIAADEEKVDFVLVAPPNEDIEERALQDRIRIIRRSTTAHIIASHAFCLRAGGPRAVFNAGADGLQIPAQKLYKLMSTGVSSVEAMKQLPPAERVVGATLLIAGGTVGAGIIALPVKTAAAGFIPSMAAMAACWLFMITTASLLLELSLWYGPGTNLTTMAKNTLGVGGKTLVTALYLFIYGATLTAYMAEGANFLNMALTAFGYSFPVWTIVTAFTALFGAVLLSGPDATDKVNSVCLAVAIGAYGLLLKVAAGSILASNLLRSNWGAAPAALPVMVVAFTFHNIVPSLLAYLGSSKRVMQAIIMGSGIPFLMYAIWELVILGTIQPGVQLTSAAQIIDGLSEATGGKAALSVKVFSFFAIVTSFLGVGLGCIDFLKDLLMRKTGPFSGQVSAGTILETLVPLSAALLPPLIVACAAPHIFYSALEFSGTFRLVLFGLLPVMMVWKGRYADKNKPFVVGGKPLLSIIMLIAMTVLSVEWGGRLGLLPRFAA